MSPLLRDRIEVFLSPTRVDLVRWSRGIKPKQRERQTATCVRDPDVPAWQPPLMQLKQMIPNGAGAEIAFLVSNHFVRYAVIPPHSKIETPAELYAYAAFQMKEVYGDRVTAWEVSVSSWDAGGGAVCAAVERDLLEELKDFAASGKMRLKSMEPYFASAFDHWHKRIDNSRAWFALVESGRFCLASLENGGWRRILNQRTMDGVEDELVAALEREALLFSGKKEATEHVYLFAPEHPEFSIPEDAGWHTVYLQTESTPPPPHYPRAALISAAGTE